MSLEGEIAYLQSLERSRRRFPDLPPPLKYEGLEKKLSKGEKENLEKIKSDANKKARKTIPAMIIEGAAALGVWVGIIETIIGPAIMLCSERYGEIGRYFYGGLITAGVSIAVGSVSANWGSNRRSEIFKKYNSLREEYYQKYKRISEERMYQAKVRAWNSLPERVRQNIHFE